MYVHCLCHRLNLVLCDTAEACSAIKKFFGILQEIYVFFGGSAPHWALLQALSSEEKAISLKGLSNTRWESRHSSVFALLARFPDVIKTLTRLKLTSDKAPVRHKAGALLENIVKMEFLVPLVFWEQILQFTNGVSKMLQSETVELSVATELLKLAMDDNVQSLRNNFEAICQTAEGLAKKWHFEAKFQNSVGRVKKKFFDELTCDERLESAKDCFRIKVFLPTIDMCLGQMKQRFKSLQEVVNTFQFLFPEVLKQASDENLIQLVSEFLEKYKDDVSESLVGQVLSFRSWAKFYILDEKTKSAMDVLKILIKLDLVSCFPDLVSAYMLFLTLPVSVASDERSF